MVSSQESRTDTGRSLTQPASSSVVVVNLWTYGEDLTFYWLRMSMGLGHRDR
jgi:hypothetical protein